MEVDMKLRQLIYYMSVVMAGGVLLAIGQSWAIGVVAGAGAGAVTVSISTLWRRQRSGDEQYKADDHEKRI
jgi:hypothetical protein